MAEYDDTRLQLEQNIDQAQLDRLIQRLIERAQGRREGDNRFERRALQDYINELVGRSRGDVASRKDVRQSQKQLDEIERPLSEADIDERINELVKPDQYKTEPYGRKPSFREMDQGQGGSYGTRRVTNPDYDAELEEYNRQVNKIRKEGELGIDVDPYESARTGGTATTEDLVREGFDRGTLNDEVARRAAELQGTHRGNKMQDFAAKDRFDLNRGMMDEMVQRILDQQFADATAQVNARYGRGDLNDAGLSQAMDYLNMQRGGATDSLNKFANTVLSEGQQRLTDFNTDWAARTQDRNFDMGDFKTGFRDMYKRTSGGLEDALMGKIGQTDFFKPQTAVTKAGRMTGPTSASGASSSYFRRDN